MKRWVSSNRTYVCLGCRRKFKKQKTNGSAHEEYCSFFNEEYFKWDKLYDPSAREWVFNKPEFVVNFNFDGHGSRLSPVDIARIKAKKGLRK